MHIFIGIKMRIGYIGLGKLGLPCAEVIANKGYRVQGYDVIRVDSDTVEIVTDIRIAVKDKEIVFVAVPTPHDPEYDGNAPTSHLSPKDFDYNIVENVLQECNKYMTADQVLVLISTVLPGITRSKFDKIINNTQLIYNPYLIAMGSVSWDMINPEMIMIGTKDGNIDEYAKKLIDFYKDIMENDPRYVVGTWDECECIKIFYNTFISAKISLVNMIQDVAEKQGNINVDVVTDALAKSSMRIMGQKYMTAGMGDGGACHPRDNIALRHMARKLDLGYDLFDSIMKSREIQARNLAKKLVELAKIHQMDVFIHGKAYKPNVPYCNGSYSLLVGHYCNELGHTPKYIDPMTGDSLERAYGVILLAHNVNVTYGSSHANEFYCEIEKGSIIVDPWRKLKQTKDYTVISYGNTRISL